LVTWDRTQLRNPSHVSYINVGANSIGHMGQLYYNRLTNNRIKSIALGTIMLLAFGLFILVINTVDKEVLNIYQGLIFSFVVIVATILLGQNPFGQVIETIDEKNIATYYKLGGQKIKYRILDKPKSVNIEQDSTRYYCITFKMPSGQSWIIEKYPTMDEANERLLEFKSVGLN
jgi:hypothetical protein